MHTKEEMELYGTLEVNVFPVTSQKKRKKEREREKKNTFDFRNEEKEEQKVFIPFVEWNRENPGASTTSTTTTTR